MACLKYELDMREDHPPLVSVITVTFNCEDSVSKTIESVCAQNYPNIEYIVVDGNSSDNTIITIKKYLNCVSKFISEKDNGIYDAMNKGISLSSPESRFITFLNAGDIFHDSSVIKDVVSSASSTKTHLYGNFVSEGQLVKTPGKLNEFILATDMVCHQAFFFCTEIHRRHLYDTSLKICADYKFLIDQIRVGVQFMKIERTLVDFDTTGVSKLNRASLHSEKRKIRKMYPKLFLYHGLKRILRNIW
jgi:glycosyltransferase involved in cell wall biosynthesis